MYRLLSIRLFMTFVIVGVASASSDGNGESPAENLKDRSDGGGNLSPIDMYRSLFEKHRVMQLDAVKSIQTFGDYAQRHQLVKIMIQQLFKVLGEGKVNLTEWGYMPGDPFPVNTTIRDSMSKVLENVAMFGDLVLRLPDITHEIFDKNKEWHLILGWGVWFCNESKIFQGNSAKLLSLMAQEVNLIPKEENYVNPFKNENMMKEQMRFKDSKPKSKAKKKKERKKGPRLSGGGQHTEL
ncbi:coiled-coil domain-containing protein 134-like [Ylistrum balloti]|uniref:coiled-coil domain-containing protein 134-like n=1 Tax=Ylistrum balloti TaxID=509963 RepID=UPI002905ADAC|nr:coiled-coil domain-containing protein 134-like [Ylistrum balloti]